MTIILLKLHGTAKVVLGCFDVIWKACKLSCPWNKLIGHNQKLEKDEVFVERLHTLFVDIGNLAPLLLEASKLRLGQAIQPILKEILSILQNIFKQIEKFNNITILGGFLLLFELNHY